MGHLVDTQEIAGILQKTSAKNYKKEFDMELQNSTLDDLAAVIGFTATLRLAAWFGDRGNLYVPDVVEEGQLLVRLIGLSAAKKLSQEWGHQHLSVPRLRAYEDDERKRTIWWLLDKGMATKAVAHEMRLSERRVQQIQRELEAIGLLPIIAPKNTGKNGPQNTPSSSLKNRGENAPQITGSLPTGFFPKSKKKRG